MANTSAHNSSIHDVSNTVSEMNYAHAFKQLEQVSQQLSQQTLVDIDQLLPMVDEAMTAYQFCQARISAVESLLAEKLKTMTE